MKIINPFNILDVNAIKFDLKMKLTSLFLLLVLFQLNANNSYAQKTKISLNLERVGFKQILTEIERNTDFNFFYDNTTFNSNRKLSINFKNKNIHKALNQIFRGSGITYEIYNRQIILKRPDLLQVSAQQTEITGQVTDETGEPLPGATVLFKDSNIGVSTDFNGKFKLIKPERATTLVISYVGYQTQEIVIDGRTVINVQLVPGLDALNEVVLIGYGSVKKEALTGSVGVVDIKNITNQAPTANLDNALQGQVAGVYVTTANGQPGAAARIRIRGTTSLLGSNQPLYVIDGIPVVPNSNIPIGGTEGRNLGNELAQEGLSTPIGNINTNDIESISILKDASAAAIYGSRAANGVIIITTKQGVFSGAPKFDASVSISTQNARTLDVLNAAQFKEAWTTAVSNGTINNAYTQSVLDGTYFGDADTNWEDEVSPSSPITTVYNLSMYGGSKSTRYNTSIGVNQQDGIYNRTGFDRYSFNLNLESVVNDIWKIGSKINVSFADQHALDGGLTQLTYSYRPDIPVRNDQGAYSFSPQYSFENPVARSKAYNDNKTTLLLGSFFTELTLAEGLKLKSMFALNYNNGNQKSFYPKFTFTGGWNRNLGDGDGYAQESRSTFTNTVWDNTLSYSKIIADKHQLDAVIGASFEKSKSSNTKAWGEGFFNDVLTNITSATEFTSGSSFESGSGLASYFGRFNYDFDHRYLVTLAARIDGSSKFATDNKYAFFPAAAVAWRISEEAFLSDNEVIDDLKLKVSLGKTGQQDFSDYAWRTLFSTYDYGGEPSIILSQLGNDQLKWETTNQFDIGLDFTLFDNRLSGEFGYYTKTTKDALFTAITPGSTGFTSIIANVGDTENTGFEIGIKGDLIRTQDVTWNLGFNWSKNKNKLTKISDDFLGEDGFLTGFPGGGRLREGSPIGLIYGYRAEGLFQDQDVIDALNAASPTGTYQNARTSPGDIRFKDISGPDGVPDGRITNLDQEVIGNAQADFFGGITSTIRYKGLSLSAMFTYAVGNELQAFSLARDTNFSNTFLGENKTTAVLDAWTPQNTSTDIPRIVYGDPNDNDRLSSHYVYDASYLRLKTLNLGYTFNQNFLKKIKFLDNLSIYAIGQNLWTITKYPGADPEATNLYNNDISSGRDNNRFPVTKVFSAGIRLGF
ncbi:TonB-dependent receptor [Flavobacteriaceae bacterium F08102]|nr:TonB-dependent receptor [Flavobacteriaceae bacterium F08102]